jgi:hypothetical protein
VLLSAEATEKCVLADLGIPGTAPKLNAVVHELEEP